MGRKRAFREASRLQQFGLIACVVCGCACSSGSAEPRSQGKSPIVLITGATVIDGTGTPARKDVDVLIKGDSISAVQPDIVSPEGAQIIDAAGQYVIPGLIDAHAHLDFPIVFQLTPEERQIVIDHNPRAFLYNGVTTILNLSAQGDIWQKREEQRTGALLGPRIYAMGRSFTPVDGWGSRHGGALANAAEARTRAREYIAKGTDGFKIVIEDGLGGSGTYKVMPEDMLRAIAEEAHQAGVPMYIHAINLDEFRRAAAVRPRAIVHGLEDPLPDGDPLLKQLVDNQIYVIPTLSLFESFNRFDGRPEGFDDPVLKGTLPDFLWARMRRPEFMAAEKQRFTAIARMDPYRWAKDTFPTFQENTRKMHEAGVRIGVGTDGGGTVGYNFQGYNTPREVELLVESGLSPMEALVAATRRGAEVIGVQDRLGTIEAGKLADLLILSADPLANVGNLRRIETIVLNGSVIARATLTYGAEPAREE